MTLSKSSLWFGLGLLVVVLVPVVKTGLRLGLGNWQSLAGSLALWLGIGLAIAGWIVGWDLLRIMNYRDVKKLIKIGDDNVDKYLKNVLTAAVVTILGLWIVSSSTSMLGVGLVLGLANRLLKEGVGNGVGLKEWFWVFARKFSEKEQRSFLAVWLAGVVLMWIGYIRR